MKNTFKVLALILALVACSDFFPEKVVERAGGPAKPGGPLPDKAVIDQNACAYGELASSDSKQQFLWQTAVKAICPKVRQFRYEMTLLRLSADDLCLGPGSARAQADLERNWFGVVGAFEYLVAHPMEPLRAAGKISQDLYSWPMQNKFALNAELIKASQQDEAYAMNLAATRKGLTAIERLIYNKEAMLAPGLSGRLRPEEEAFNALSPARRQRARCLVLNRMVADASGRAEELYAEWDSGQGQYPRRMIDRVKSGAGPMVLNETSDGLFYFEKVKDFKLAMPLGLNARCLKDRCPDEIEHPFSGAGLEALRVNFEALRAGMTGVEGGPGFLSLVREVGRGDLAQSMQALLDQMDATVQEIALGGDLRAQVESADKARCADANSPVPLCRLYYQIKDFSMLYRTDFMTALNLNPPRTEADND